MIHPEHVAAIIELLEENTGIRLTGEQVITIIGADEELAQEIDDYGVEGDTLMRETLINKLTEHLIQRKWPTYGDIHLNVEEYLETLHKAAHAAGMEITDEEWTFHPRDAD